MTEFNYIVSSKRHYQHRIGVKPLGFKRILTAALSILVLGLGAAVPVAANAAGPQTNENEVMCC